MKGLTMSLSLSCQPICPGHGPGKFSSCLAETLYDRDGDAVTGSVEAFGHSTLFIVEEDGTSLPAGFFILHEDSQGFVNVEAYDTKEEARVGFEAAEDQYGDWLEDAGEIADGEDADRTFTGGEDSWLEAAYEDRFSLIEYED